MFLRVIYISSSSSSSSSRGLLHLHRLRMEKNPPRVSPKDGTPEVASSTSSRDGHGPSCSRRKQGREGGGRYTVDEDLTIECSGRYCKSCTAGLIADCVALCCCPCALVNFFALAFVKIPWVVGRRCLGRAKRKKKKKKKKLETMKRNKYKKSSTPSESDDDDIVLDKDGNFMGMVKPEKEILGIATCERVGDEEIDGEEEEMESAVSARLEAERVWLELYQVGHLGFGRVSFTGIQ